MLPSPDHRCLPPDLIWRPDPASGLRLPPGVIERSDGTLVGAGVRVRARRGSTVRACLQLAVTLLGDDRMRTGGQLAALAGALPGMRLTAAADEHGDLALEVRGGGYHARRVLYRGPGGKAVLLNHLLSADPSGRGIGTASQVIQVAAAVRLGIARLEAWADSLDGAAGWLVLPRWGYDGVLEPEVRALLPEQWSRLRRLAQLLREPAGWDWWQEHGAILWVEFDLRPGSRALDRLRTYLDDRLAAGRTLPTALTAGDGRP